MAIIASINSEDHSCYVFDEAETPIGDLHPDLVVFKAPCGMLFTAACVRQHLNLRRLVNMNDKDQPIPYGWDCTALDVLAAVMAEYGWR